MTQNMLEGQSFLRTPRDSPPTISGGQRRMKAFGKRIHPSYSGTAFSHLLELQQQFGGAVGPLSKVWDFGSSKSERAGPSLSITSPKSRPVQHLVPLVNMSFCFPLFCKSKRLSNQCDWENWRTKCQNVSYPQRLDFRYGHQCLWRELYSHLALLESWAVAKDLFKKKFWTKT